jgi:hypothetical protein
MAKSVRMRSKAWLAASVWLRLVRLLPPASRMRCSRRLRETLAAAPGLLTHALVTEEAQFCPMDPKLKHTTQNNLNRFEGGGEPRHGRTFGQSAMFKLVSAEQPWSSASTPASPMRGQLLMSMVS